MKTKSILLPLLCIVIVGLVAVAMNTMYGPFTENSSVTTKTTTLVNAVTIQHPTYLSVFGPDEDEQVKKMLNNFDWRNTKLSYKTEGIETMIDSRSEMGMDQSILDMVNDNGQRVIVLGSDRSKHSDNNLYSLVMLVAQENSFAASGDTHPFTFGFEIKCTVSEQDENVGDLGLFLTCDRAEKAMEIMASSVNVFNAEMLETYIQRRERERQAEHLQRFEEAKKQAEEAAKRLEQ